MARRPSVRYWQSVGGYACEFNGKRKVLAKGPDDSPTGPVYRAALTAFRELLEGKTVLGPQKTVAEVWEKFEVNLKDKRQTGTLTIRDRHLKPFVAEFGHRQVASLLPHEVIAFVSRRRQPRRVAGQHHDFAWGDGSVRIFWDSLDAMLRWALATKLVANNPMEGTSKQERPPAGSRGSECVIEPHEHRAVLQAEKTTHWQDYLVVLHATGARPGEIANARVENYDESRNALIYHQAPRQGMYRHKKAKHEDRVIFLSPAALEIIKRRCQEHPTGTLFGYCEGKKYPRPGDVLRPWSPKAIVDRFRQLRKWTGLKHLVAYSYRHTWATAWLRAGKPVEKLAHLLGTSPEMVHRHYGHLLRYGTDLYRDMLDFSVTQALLTEDAATFQAPNGQTVTVGIMDK